MIRIILKIERQDDETRMPKVAAQIALECTAPCRPDYKDGN